MSNSLDDYPWWKQTTVYQIYPRSFQDSTGNGIGDLKGIISRLDYLYELGVETVWFSPFFSSPQKDFGYDVSDYKSIAPEYGSMEDCELLISEIHQRGMRIVLDLVLNHTSDEHPWFEESRSSKDNPKRDWYVWRDGKKPDGKQPPNNWQSMITGSGWHYHNATDQWYWASFLPFQPDLNYRNPEAKHAMFDIMRFWLDKGVDGFRLDIIGSIYEDKKFRDNPRNWQFLPSGDERGILFRSSKMTVNVEENFVFVKELRSSMEEYSPERFLVGEAFGRYHQLVKYCGGNEYNGLHSVFLFQTMETKFSARGFKKLIAQFEEHFPDPLIPTWVFSNHDRYRNIHRLKYDLRKAKLQAGIQLTVRGIPYIYYGEEIGMEQVEIPIKEAKDALAKKFSKYPKFITNLLMKMTNGAINRDGCRTPMQWNTTDYAGFTESEHPWLPLGKKTLRTTRKTENIRPNVESQINSKRSLLNCYRYLLHLRKEYLCLNRGSIHIVNEKNSNLLVYDRCLNESSLRIIANFSSSKQTIEITIPNKESAIFSTYFYDFGNMDPSGFQYTLYPYELCIISLS